MDNVNGRTSVEQSTVQVLPTHSAQLGGCSERHQSDSTYISCAAY